MNLEKAILQLIYFVLNASVGDKLPSINTLTVEHECSRGIFQKAITYLTKEQIVIFEKNVKGTTIVEINYKKIKDQYFPELTISMPLVTLNNRLDTIPYFAIETIKSHSNEEINLSFSDSTITRLYKLESNKCQVCLISEDYFHQLDTQDYNILETFITATPAYTELIISDNSNLNYSFDEVCVNTVLSDANKLSQPNKYLLISKPYIYNLIRNVQD